MGTGSGVKKEKENNTKNNEAEEGEKKEGYLNGKGLSANETVIMLKQMIKSLCKIKAENCIASGFLCNLMIIMF